MLTEQVTSLGKDNVLPGVTAKFDLSDGQISNLYHTTIDDSYALQGVYSAENYIVNAGEYYPEKLKSAIKSKESTRKDIYLKLEEMRIAGLGDSKSYDELIKKADALNSEIQKTDNRFKKTLTV